MKVLLAGPYPPPHGGVSVHVRTLRSLLEEKGNQCRVLNVDPRAPHSADYIKISGGIDFFTELLKHARNGWLLHVHTNGHNVKSWLIVASAGIAALFGRWIGQLPSLVKEGCRAPRSASPIGRSLKKGARRGGWFKQSHSIFLPPPRFAPPLLKQEGSSSPACSVTLHSGILPSYLNAEKPLRRLLARVACALNDRIICVNSEIRSTLATLGVAERKLELKEAYLATPATHVQVPAPLSNWIETRSPLLTTTMFMRPEYGYAVLQTALDRLRRRYPQIGCVVMGVDGMPNGDSLWHAGDVDHNLCLALISRSDVFVRPTFKDGDSISVREAQSLGIPVVASNVGARPDGTLLFEPGDVDGFIQQVERVCTRS